MRTKTVGVRELKAKASALLQELRAGDLEILITVRGQTVARMEPVYGDAIDGMGNMRAALAVVLPDAGWEDFQEAKRLWEPRPLEQD